MYIFTGHERCPQCRCLLDDHSLPADIAADEPVMAMAAELSGEDIITCGDCDNCSWNYTHYEPNKEKQLDLVDQGDYLNQRLKEEGF